MHSVKKIIDVLNMAVHASLFALSSEFASLYYVLMQHNASLQCLLLCHIQHTCHAKRQCLPLCVIVNIVQDCNICLSVFIILTLKEDLVLFSIIHMK